MDGKTPDVVSLGRFLNDAGLAKQKCPEGIELVDDLPRTASGKIRKDALRARLASVARS
jgi:non-ribosomal peptide synthetase component E (peptide arylation enzyme)